MIVQGQFAPGTRLVELDIAARLQTSQAPVREALQRLEADGLVERRGRSGTFVVELSTDEMYEIFTVRSVVEAVAIRRTTQRIQAAQLDELHSLILGMRSAGVRGDMMDLAEFDLAFHQNILQWSEHRALLRVWLPLHTQVERFVVMTHPHYFPDLVAIADTHLPILDALRGGDGEVAAQRIEEHIMLIWTRFERDQPRV